MRIIQICTHSTLHHAWSEKLRDADSSLTHIFQQPCKICEVLILQTLKQNLWFGCGIRVHTGKTETLLSRWVSFLIYEDGVIFWLVTEEITWQNWGGVCDLLNWSDARPAAPRSVCCRWDQFPSWGIGGACILKIHGYSACKLYSPELYTLRNRWPHSQSKFMNRTTILHSVPHPCWRWCCARAAARVRHRSPPQCGPSSPPGWRWRRSSPPWWCWCNSRCLWRPWCGAGQGSAECSCRLPSLYQSDTRHTCISHIVAAVSIFLVVTWKKKNFH